MVVLYRLNGGQALAISSDNATFDTRDTTFYGVVIDPAMPDGENVNGKIVVGTTLRNATAGELAAFATAEATDTNLQQRVIAIVELDTDPVRRKVLRGIVSVLIDELNLIRAKVSNTANPAQPMPARTLSQARTAIINTINGGTVD